MGELAARRYQIEVWCFVLWAVLQAQEERMTGSEPLLISRIKK
jgi:hypothetical protein